MCKVNISLSEKQVSFLKEFTSKQYPGSRDNVLTANPIHLVQTRREKIIDEDFGNPDVIKYHVSDWQEDFDTPEELIKAYYENKYEECPIPIVSYDEAYVANRFVDIEGEEQVIVDEQEYFEAYGIDEDFYNRVAIEYDYETVAVFFILDEAKEYIKYQGHNLDNPRTYTIGAGYGNQGEYNYFWQLLFDIGSQLNEKD